MKLSQRQRTRRADPSTKTAYKASKKRLTCSLLKSVFLKVLAELRHGARRRPNCEIKAPSIRVKLVTIKDSFDQKSLRNRDHDRATRATSPNLYTRVMADELFRNKISVSWSSVRVFRKEKDSDWKKTGKKRQVAVTRLIVLFT